MKGRSLSLGKYYLIYMKLTDKQKKQIEEELTAFTNEYAEILKEIGLPEGFLGEIM